MSITVLGIESSCDETAVAIVRDDKTILAQKLRSQTADHARYGGVVPEIAARAHLQILPVMVEECLKEAKIDWNGIDAIGATAGPGLIGGLLVGLTLAQGLGFARNIPVYGLNHLEGHALTCRFTHDAPLPYLLLLVSGGHSQFLSVEGVGKYKRLGTTIDDAVGEAFDKAAKLLGFGYPGGPHVEKCAEDGTHKRFDLPVPMRGKPGCDFSLSGLKTALRHKVAALHNPLFPEDKADLAASFQFAVGEMLADRLQNAMMQFERDHPGLKPENKILAIAGGVAANQYLHARLTEATSARGWQTIYPPLSLCSDNAVMMAWATIERIKAGMKPEIVLARPRWPLDENSVKIAGAKA